MFTDFEYAGFNLSDFGFIIASIDGSSSGNISVGSNLTFNTVKNRNSSRNTKTSTSYDEVYVTEPFQIMKYDCKEGVSFVDEYETRAIMKWLNRKEYEKFKPDYTGTANEMGDTYWEGYFNIEAVTVAGEVVGFSLTFTTNAPFGYGEDSMITADVERDGAFMIESDSDEVGFLYPNVQIIIRSDGDLTIKNSLDSTILSIKNCKQGEVITMDGENKTIISSMAHETLPNDFNYRWLKIFSDYDYSVNKYTVSLPCEIVVTYNPIHKVGIVNG